MKLNKLGRGVVRSFKKNEAGLWTSELDFEEGNLTLPKRQRHFQGSVE